MNKLLDGTKMTTKPSIGSTPTRLKGNCSTKQNLKIPKVKSTSQESWNHPTLYLL